jgi:hypothetical protein
VLLRADLDALPVKEIELARTEAPRRAWIRTVTTPVMHACDPGLFMSAAGARRKPEIGRINDFPCVSTISRRPTR